jgi:lipopolysaccharide/colanic/teichoic acid biosynthesis glycosyltransferase
MSVRLALNSNSHTDDQVEAAPADTIKAGMPRSLEVILAFVALVLSAPLLALALAAIFLSSRGPVIFRQTRIGQRGRPFIIYKVRTMSVSHDQRAEVTAADDARILRVGRWLRRAKVDELPELWNVLKGDMALVGPRPEVPRYVDTQNPLWKIVLQARPGITDPVTFSLRNEETLLSRVDGDREDFYLRTLQPYKLNGYVAYLKERSFWRDVKILLQTCRAIVMPNTVLPPTIKGI